MKLPEGELSPEAHRGIVECLKTAARRSRELRLERERSALAQEANSGAMASGAQSQGGLESRYQYT